MPFFLSRSTSSPGLQVCWPGIHPESSYFPPPSLPVPLSQHYLVLRKPSNWFSIHPCRDLCSSHGNWTDRFKTGYVISLLKLCVQWLPVSFRVKPILAVSLTSPPTVFLGSTHTGSFTSFWMCPAHPALKSHFSIFSAWNTLLSHFFFSKRYLCGDAFLWDSYPLIAEPLFHLSSSLFFILFYYF